MASSAGKRKTVTTKPQISEGDEEEEVPTTKTRTRRQKGTTAKSKGTGGKKKQKKAGNEVGEQEEQKKTEASTTGEQQEQPPPAQKMEVEPTEKKEETKKEEPETSTTTITSNIAGDSSSGRVETKEGKKEEGEGEEKKTSKVLERGHIYFFYRPKIEVEEAEGPEDIARLFILLAPKEKESLNRLIIMGKKKMPEVSTHERYFAFVSKVTKDMDEIRKQLGPSTYETKTRGERHVPACRPAGEGYYGIVEHGPHTHLAFVLELPKEIGEVQKAMNIEEEGSYVVMVKNPEVPSSTFFHGAKQASFPKHLQEKFEGRKFNSINPPDFLDHEDAELIIIAASENIAQEFGTTGIQLEEEEKVDVKRLKDDQVFSDLHLSKKQFPPQPLITGEWK